MIIDRSFGFCRRLLFTAVLAVAVLAGSASYASYWKYDSDTISMYSMNSPTALKRINNGYFSVMYRGFGSRKADRIGGEELLGFHFMIDTPCLSRGLRSIITDLEKSGKNTEDAFMAARKEHVQTLRGFFRTLESTRELFENRKDKSMKGALAGMPNPETHFLFASPRIGVAKMYGPIVMIIEETRARGMDLNSIARDARYYTLARFLKNVSDLQFKLILADYVADRDEYVIPSYICPTDVSGMIVHSPAPFVIGNRIAVPPPAVERVYRKYFRNGAMVIDVVDGKDRLIERLSAVPSASAIEKNEVRSPMKLPENIRRAWNSFVQSRRSRYAVE
jgi:hypothetical protein